MIFGTDICWLNLLMDRLIDVKFGFLWSQKDFYENIILWADKINLNWTWYVTKRRIKYIMAAVNLCWIRFLAYLSNVLWHLGMNWKSNNSSNSGFLGGRGGSGKPIRNTYTQRGAGPYGGENIYFIFFITCLHSSWFPTFCQGVVFSVLARPVSGRSPPKKKKICHSG